MPAHRTINQHPNDADILLRVSATGQAQDDRFSLPTQEQACRAFAVTHGWNVHSIQQDAISGETIYRPGFQAVLDDLRQGRVGRVIVYDVDRAGRDTYVGTTLLHECKQAGATLHIQQMPELELATGTPMSNTNEAMFFMRLTPAQQELASLRECTQRGRNARLAAGNPLVSCLPLFGYEFVNDGRGTPIGFREHPIYAAVVRRIFREVADGMTLSDVCRWLERDRIPTRSQVEQEMRQAAGLAPSRRSVATTWNRTAVANIIWHPAYSGQPAANRHPRSRTHGLDPETGQARTVTHRERVRAEDVVPLSTDVWPPLVDAELAEQARARLRANREQSARRLAAADWETMLLRSGYVYCLQCGKPMATAHRQVRGRHLATGFNRVYRCNTHTNAPNHRHADRCGQSIATTPLDAEVWAHVLRLAEEDEVVIETAMASWRTRVSSRQASEAAALRTAKHALEMARRDEANARRVYQAEIDEHYAARLRLDWTKAVDALEQAEARLAALQEQIAHDPAQHAYEDVLVWARDWRHRLSPDSPYAERRQALHVLGLRVFVAPPENPKRVAVGARGFAGGEARHFVVVLGWPAGVRQAIPWTVTPLGAGALESAYLAEYFPGMEIFSEEAADHHGMYSEVVRLVPADVPAQELLAPAKDIGRRLGQPRNSEGNPGEHAESESAFVSGSD